MNDIQSTTPWAILDRARTYIEVVGDISDDINDADTIGDMIGWPDTTADLRRVVIVPMGGEIGDYVTVDDDGEATIVEV